MLLSAYHERSNRLTVFVASVRSLRTRLLM